jgi:hypothetical protein
MAPSKAIAISNLDTNSLLFYECFTSREMLIKFWKKLRKFDLNFSGFVSALGQKRTFAVQKVMSALPLKADKRGRGRIVL